ncbi:hypothetical protein IFR05_016802 [Cadophora sp. M221]|nr:hypothetical protein IFR05_016802 [Cadophora sp. M221]
MFTIFPLLSLEMRLLVWEFVCFQPRLVDIWPTKSGIELLARLFLEEGFEEPYYNYTHCGTVPSILHTSREARTVGLQYYQLEFGTEAKADNSGASRGTLSFSTPPRIFVNWECDIVCPMLELQSEFMDPDSMPWALASIYPQIRKFAIAANDICGTTSTFATRRSSDPPMMFASDQVSLQFSNIRGIDDQNTVPIPLWGTARLRNMRKARDNVVEVISVVSGRRKEEIKKFVAPVISFAFLDVEKSS